MAQTTGKHQALTPFLQAKAMIMPFLLVPGGAALLLGLAAVSVGLNPAEFMADFVADSAIVLSPLALKCLLIWAIYTAFYILLTWAYWPHYRSAFDYDRIDPGIIRYFHQPVSHLLHKLLSALAGKALASRKHSVWRGLGFAWHP